MNKEETLEEAAEKYHQENAYAEDTLVQLDRDKDTFFAGANWQAERMYTEDQLAYFAGYCAGAKYLEPNKSVSEILEEWKEKSIFNKK